MLDALCQLKTLDSATHSSALTSVLLEKKEPSLPKQLPAEDYSLFDQKLNKDQKEAVRFALQSPEIALIHGPPGKSFSFFFYSKRQSKAAKQLKSLHI